MRLVLALALAAGATSLATPAHATCTLLWQRAGLVAYTCSPPDGPAKTTVCYGPADTCVTV